MQDYGSYILWGIAGLFTLGLLSRRFRRGRHMHPSTFGGAEFEGALRAAGQSQLQPLHDLIAGTTNADMKVAFLQGLSQEPVKNVQKWAAAHAREPAAMLMLGEAMIVEARRRRGNAPSAKLSEAAYMGMYEALTEAITAFKGAAELAPKDATPWIRMCDLAAGLELPREEAEGFFKEACVRDPESFRAHVAMTHYLTERWHGSHDEMFKFVDSVRDEAPEHSDLHMLVAYAAWEQHHFLISSRTAPQKADAAVSPEALEQLVRAAYEQSLGSPAYIERPQSVVARNYAAFWFFIARMQPELRNELQALDFNYSMTPWGLLNDPMTTFALARRQAGL